MRTTSAILASALLLASATSCRAATEITLTIRTNVSCADVATWQGVAVYVGKPGAESESQAPTLVTKRCEGQGEIGSLVLVPSGEKDELVGVRVVAGLGRDPEDCLANGYQGGCIVARRAIRFTPHADLSLEIDLTSNCRDIACDPRNTCSAGSCQPTLSSAPSMEGPAAGTPTVRCGQDGVFCPLTGDVCCLTVDVEAQMTHGECKPAHLCSDIVLHCDDDTDCPDGGPDGALEGICVLSYTQSETSPWVPTAISHANCLIAASGNGGLHVPHGLALCEERKNCADNQFQCNESRSALLPSYHWCQLEFR